MSGYRANSEPRSKQAGRQQAEADGRLPRKSRVVVSVSRAGDLWIDVPDEPGHDYISHEERSA
jgi:hypothetical protein